MGVKLVCLDLDGTLLNDDKTMSENNIKTLKEIKNTGIKIAISTGRPYINASYFGSLIGDEVSIISSNGAYLREKEKDILLNKESLSLESVISVTNIIKKYGFTPQFHTRNSVFTEKLEYSSYFLKAMNTILPKEFWINIVMVDNWNNYTKDYNDEFIKSIFIHEDIDLVEKIKEELLRIPSLNVTSSLPTNIEINEKGVSKGKTVLKLANYFGISKDEILCMGDNKNDISMLSICGTPIAMGNAGKEIKDIAKYVTKSNNEDGVAHALKKYILKG
ncbi:MAG: Cof-type HAD-IIB family hydrolase [Clostridiaceae bacterium]